VKELLSNRLGKESEALEDQEVPRDVRLHGEELTDLVTQLVQKGMHQILFGRKTKDAENSVLKRVNPVRLEIMLRVDAIK